MSRLQSVATALAPGEADQTLAVEGGRQVLPKAKKRSREEAQANAPADALEILQMMEGANDNDFLFSQGGDRCCTMPSHFVCIATLTRSPLLCLSFILLSFMFVDSQALRGLEAVRAQRNGPGRRGGHRDDFTLPDAHEPSISRGITGPRSFFMPGEEEEDFAVLPDDDELDGLAPRQPRHSGSAGGAARSPFGELEPNAGLAPVAEDDDDMPPPPLPMDDDDELEEGAAGKSPPKKRRKTVGILKKKKAAPAMRTDSAITLHGDLLRKWLSDATDISCVRRKLGDVAVDMDTAPAAGKKTGGGVAALSVRVDSALRQPAQLLLAGHRLPVEPGRTHRGRLLCPTLMHLLARNIPPVKTRAQKKAVEEPDDPLQPGAGDDEFADMPPAPFDDDDVEAFRHGAHGPLGRSPASGSFGALFGRRSNVSAATGSASALAAALAGATSPSSGHTALTRGGLAPLSDGFDDGVLPDDLPDVGGVPFPEGRVTGRGLSQRFESALGFESGPTGYTQPAPGAGPGLSGVSAAVMAYVNRALGTASEEAAGGGGSRGLVFDAMVRGNNLGKTQTAQLFAQVLVLATTGLVAVSQEAPYGDITITRGSVPLAAH